MEKIMSAKKFYEMVIGIHKTDFDKIIRNDLSDFIPLGAETLYPTIKRMGQFQRFAYRGLCENDQNFKQLIPYCIVTQDDKIFAYRRLGQSVEERLVGKYSIGVGGHMNPALYGIDPIPASFHSSIKENMLRELNEELNIQCPEDTPMLTKIVGLINSAADPVSSVHVGIVYHVTLPLAATVEVAEKDVLEGKFLSFKDLSGISREDLELWTEITINNYIANLEG